MNERIVSAAIMHDGRPYSVPAPGRHHQVIAHLRELFPGCEFHGEQGFMTDEGRFVDRREAAGIASSAGQIIKHASQWDNITILFSEDLW